MAVRLNKRFVAGKPSSDVASTGVLIHQFDGYGALRQPWLPCDMGERGGTCDEYTASRWSGSIINGALRGVYSSCHPGVIISPTSSVAHAMLCAYAHDGSTQGKSCSSATSGCISGCYPFCERVRPNGIAEPPGCCWRAAQLREMLTEALAHPRFAGSSGRYNEVILDARALARLLPHSIEAFVFAKTCARASGERSGRLAEHAARLASARESREAFLAAYASAVDAAAVPLLEMDLDSGTGAPFKYAQT